MVETGHFFVIKLIHLPLLLSKFFNLKNKMKREYWDIDLKNQSKKRLKTLNDGLKKFDGIIHDQHESLYFTGRLAWRNPLLLRVSLPEENRWSFISFTRLWLYPPSQIGIDAWHEPPPMPLRGDHDNAQPRRLYVLSPQKFGPFIMDFRPNGKCTKLGGFGAGLNFNYHGGHEVAERVLDGDLNILG